VAPPPPATMKILHLTRSRRSAGSSSSGFESSISSLDVKSASAVLIDVEEKSLYDERIQRQRELPAASVSLASAAVPVAPISPDDRYQKDMLRPSGEGLPTLPARPFIPRRPWSVTARPKGGRPRAVTPGERRRSGRVMDGSGDAVMRGAVRDTSATCCLTSSSTAETATDRFPPGAPADLSRDLPDLRDVMSPRQLTRRRRGGRSFADVTQQCQCRSTSGVAADRKFPLYRKQFAADDRSPPATMSTTSLQSFPVR